MGKLLIDLEEQFREKFSERRRSNKLSFWTNSVREGSIFRNLAFEIHKKCERRQAKYPVQYNRRYLRRPLPRLYELRSDTVPSKQRPQASGFKLEMTWGQRLSNHWHCEFGGKLCCSTLLEHGDFSCRSLPSISKQGLVTGFLQPTGHKT